MTVKQVRAGASIFGFGMAEKIGLFSRIIESVSFVSVVVTMGGISLMNGLIAERRTHTIRVDQ